MTEVRLPKRLLPRLQVVEYLRAFLSGRMGWDAINATLIISGAFGLFQRATVVEAGGYRKDTVGEDMELVVRLHRTAWIAASRTASDSSPTPSRGPRHPSRFASSVASATGGSAGCSRCCPSIAGCSSGRSTGGSAW